MIYFKHNQNLKNFNQNLNQPSRYQNQTINHNRNHGNLNQSLNQSSRY